MKCNVHIDRNRTEEVVIYAHKQTGLTDAIVRLCEEDAFELIGYKGNEAFRLHLPDICCFAVEDNRIYALTENEKLLLKCRLYQLEETLPQSFVKINQSCIANIGMMERFDASVSGTLTVRFKNGYTEYVSRRNVKRVKERLGI